MSSQFNLVVFLWAWPNQFCFFVCFVCTSVERVTLDVTQTSSHQIWLCAHQAKNLFTRKLINIQTIWGCYHYCFWNSRVQGLSRHFFSLIDLFTSFFFPPTSEHILYKFWRNGQLHASTFIMLPAVLLISFLGELYNFLTHTLVI